MTVSEVARLYNWLKEKGYTLETIEKAIQYIAFGKKSESN